MASIVEIVGLTAMEQFDNVEMARVRGWNCVVKRGEFKVGDRAVYCEIGYTLPNDGNTAFLEGKRLKNRKFRKYLSQGLVCPISWIPGGDALPIGTDVSQAIGAKKWIPSEEESLYWADGKIRNPETFPKTDEERAQNCLDHLRKHLGKSLTITQKRDGTSATYYWDGTCLKICGRNFVQTEKGEGTKHYFEIAERFGLQASLERLGRLIAIQGEIFGPKINCNRHKLDAICFEVFNCYDVVGGYYLAWSEVVKICAELGLKTVPVIYEGPVMDEHLSIEKMKQLADSQMYGKDLLGEGIVMKTNGYLAEVDENGIVADGKGKRFSCKVISDRYIAKYDL